MRFVTLLLLPFLLTAQSSKSVLVITSTAGDYLMAAGEPWRMMIDQGYTVNVSRSETMRRTQSD